MNRKKIAVAPASEFQARRRLFALMGELYPVDFEVWQPGGKNAFDGAILWECCAGEKEIMSTPNLDCLVVAKSPAATIPVQTRTVKFAATAALDNAFRGQTMIEECIEAIPALRLHDSDEIVCRIDSLPYWLVRKTDTATISIVALEPEEILEGQTVYDHFNRRRWLRLLPFFHFLKRLTCDGDWETPLVRACLMFDDPNLHWPTYGFLDLRKLARHAKEFNYHASFAMVPLDAWFINPQVGALFRENHLNLSLCMHGNDHAPAELGSAMDADSFTKLFAQGLKRIAGFEKRSGVSVARVMVPPYGAFQEGAADPMLKLGYEAACVSRASLTAWNKGRAWPASFGHSVAEFLGGGLPVIPRQVLAAGHDGTYRLAAFLGQPIIPHGHHQDCARGLDLLAAAANSINSLGKVVWTDMATISRSNYLTRRTNGTLVVKMLSRRITLPVSGDVKEMVIERPWISDDGTNEPLICQEGKQTHFSGRFGRHSAAMPLQCKNSVEIFSAPGDAVDYREIGSPRFQLWPKTRRLLSETRDRLAPLRFKMRPKTITSIAK